MSMGAKFVSVVRRPAVWVPAAILAAATAIFWCTDLDRAWVRQYFADDRIQANALTRFPIGQTQPWKAIYDWAWYPAWILGVGGMVVWIASFFWTKLKPWRDPGLFYVLLLIVGPGILVNGVLKPYWDRPRPHNTTAFGGQREFMPVWQRGSGDEDSSFPSGHAAMGFYLMAPAFVYRRRRPRLALAFLLLGLASGVVIGQARIIAGCHFPSDILWAGGIIYFTALALAAPFRFGCED